MVDISGYEGHYAITSCGKVWSYKNKKFLTPHSYKNGYLCVALCKDAKPRTVSIHRLVASAYLKNENNFSDVNHIDEDKTNNAVPNLEWCSHKYNCNYGSRNEKQRQTKRSKTQCLISPVH